MENRLLARAMRLCAGNAAVRALGFGMRIWLARTVSEQALGMYEMSAQAGMLLLSPLVSGLPQAASRLTAQRLGAGDAVGAERIGRAARIMAGVGAGALCAICLPLVPLIARRMGDAGLAGPLALILPSALPLALSAVWHGLMYAQGSTLPAVLQLTEQSVRLITAFLLMAALGGHTPALDASLLAAAQAAGAVVALGLTRGSWPGTPDDTRPTRAQYEQLWRVAWPISLGRMSAAGLRSLNQLMLPGRLAVAGLSSAAALSEYGLLSGMALPTVFLPFMFTGPLATLAMPRVAAAKSGRSAARICRRTLLLAGAAGVAAYAVLWGLGPLAGQYVFDNARAGQLIRFMAPLAPLGCMTQTLNALLQGIRRERAAMRATLCCALLSTALTWTLCARPELGILGLGLAMMCGHVVQLAVHGTLLWRGLRRFDGLSSDSAKSADAPAEPVRS